MAASCQNGRGFGRRSHAVGGPIGPDGATVDFSALAPTRIASAVSSQPCVSSLLALRSLVFFTLFAMLAFAFPVYGEGGTRGANSLVPSLAVANLDAGGTATVTVGNIPPSSDGLRVYVAFSRRYAGVDASHLLGPGAVIVPRVTFRPAGNPAVFPARELTGPWPVRTVQLPVPQRAGGRSYYLQAFVEDPGALGGGGWALSEGASLIVGNGTQYPVARVEMTPDAVTVAAGEVTTFRAELRDANGLLIPVNAVGDIEFQVTTGAGSFDSPRLEANGVVAVYRAGVLPETSSVTAVERVSSNDHADTSSVLVVPGPPAETISMSADPASLPADGASITEVVGGPVRDGHGNLVLDGVLVTVAASRGTLIATDADAGVAGLQVATVGGRFGVRLRSSSSAGSSDLTSTSLVGSASGSLTIEFTATSPDIATVVLTPPAAEVTAGESVLLTAELRDGNGQLIVATSTSEFVFDAAPGSGSFSGHRLSGGRVQVTYRSSTTVESATVTATETVSGQQRLDTSSVVSVPGQPQGAIVLVASPDSIPADGQSTSTVAGGPVTDVYGNVVGNGTLVTMTASRGSLVGSDASAGTPGFQRSTVNGRFSVVLRSSTAHGASAVATTSVLGQASGSVTVEFTEVTPDVTSLVLTPPWADTEVGGDVVAMAEMRDEQAQFVPATSVDQISFSISPGEGSFSQKRLVGGRVKITFHASNTAARARIVASESVSGQSHGDSSWVTVRAGAPTGVIVLQSDPSVLPGDGQSQAVVSSSVIRDSYGNPVNDGELVTMTPSRGSILSADMSSATPGIQVAALEGRVQFDLRAPVGAGFLDIDARTPRGSAAGFLRLEVTETTGSGEFSVLQAGTLPTPRTSAGMVYDSLSEKAYLFGGIGRTLPLDIVEVDLRQPFGSQMETLPDVLPESRYGGAAVWDSLRNKAYIIGGYENPVFGQYDILSFDPSAPVGSRVTTVPGEQVPYPIAYASAVWDANADVAYVFDGGNGELRVLQFDPSRGVGAKLVDLPDRLPGLYSRNTAVWDDVAGVAYIFGGLNGFRIREDIVRFDPRAAAGSRLTILPDRIPQGRVNAAAVWDVHRKVAYLLGGSNQGSNFNQVLRFDPRRAAGSRLTVVCSMARGVTGHGAFFDRGTSRAFLLGGTFIDGGEYSDSVFAFDPENQRSNLMNKLSLPNALSTAVWDPESGRSYIFGGRLRSGFHDGIHTVDPVLTPGTQMLLVQDRLPSPRYALSSVWSMSENVAYLFGGKTSLSIGSDQVVRFDPSRSPGSRVSVLPDRLPRAIFNSASVYDPQGRVAYLFDSTTSDQPLRVIRFDPHAPTGSRVSELPDTASGRLFVAAAWDPLRNCAYLFGGSNRRGTMDEVLRFDPSRPAGARFEVLPDRLESGRSAAVAVWDSIQGVVYLFGGGNEVVMFNPAAPAGLRVETAGDIGHLISYPSAVFDAVRRRAFCFGGLNEAGEYETNVHALVEQ